MKDSEVLKQARQAIATGRSNFICNAIKHHTDATIDQSHSLRQWISRMLGYHGTYEIWVWNNHPGLKRRMNTKEFCEGRLVWLDWMITYCEKEEQEHEERTRSTGQVADPGTPAA